MVTMMLRRVQSMKCVFICLFLSSAAVSAKAFLFADCDGQAEERIGSFDYDFFDNVMYNGTLMYALVPRTSQNGRSTPDTFPVVAFMHGSTGQYEMYEDNLKVYASHGFVVLFPFIKDPEKDKKSTTTNTNGEFILKAIAYAKLSNHMPLSPLYGKVDSENMIVLGHSMGATCAIAAGRRLAETNKSGVRAVIAQHPGICGPFGPPPLPATWMPADVSMLNKKYPFVMTTAHNDAAFWPKPYTAKHEKGCFDKAKAASSGGFSQGAVFASFSDDACSEDHMHDPFPDSGHNCPFKVTVETPWILRTMKLYAQLNGQRSTRCYEMVWGSGSGSLGNATTTELTEIHEPGALSV